MTRLPKVREMKVEKATYSIEHPNPEWKLKGEKWIALALFKAGWRVGETYDVAYIPHIPIEIRIGPIVHNVIPTYWNRDEDPSATNFEVGGAANTFRLDGRYKDPRNVYVRSRKHVNLSPDLNEEQILMLLKLAEKIHRLPLSILFVCSGNTCRSPMAATMFLRMLEKDKSLHRHVVSDSAGTCASVGSPAHDNARAVIDERGLSLSHHRSMRLSQEIVNVYDLILAMDARIKRDIISNFSGANKKVHLLSEFVGERGDVADPIGKGIDVYRSTADQIEKYLLKLIAHLQPDTLT